MEKGFQINCLKGKNILFLEGPVGYFFRRFENNIKNICKESFTIVLNPGDEFFRPKNKYIAYRGPTDQWKEFISDFLNKNKIHFIFLFGESIFYHEKTIKLCKKFNISVYIFEYGYFGPNYITLEKDGINANSRFQFRKTKKKINKGELYRTFPRNRYYISLKRIYFSFLYNFLNSVFFFLYPHYKNHKNGIIVDILTKIGFYYCRIVDTLKNRNINNLLSKKISKKYFFIPLQSNNDNQIKKNSHFHSMESAVSYICKSFSENASKEHVLVFKQNRLDMERRNYKNYINIISKQYDITKRVMYLCEINNKIIIKNAIGFITVNSNLAFNAIEYGIATIILGKSICNIKGLASQTTLDKFWKEYESPDMNIYSKFRYALLEYSQFPGDFFCNFPHFY